ncbi:hypothetical protein [Dipodfec virus UOA04_Rod_1030]|nr:hypothetical protein [Dipodfec virus UOA04_Rod_1030]
MIKYATQQTYDHTATTKQDIVDFPPSIVSQDESLTVRQLLEHYTRGLDSGVAVYDSEDSDYSSDDEMFNSETAFIDPSRMDIAEREELSHSLERSAKALRASHPTNKEAKSVAAEREPSKAKRNEATSEAAADSTPVE